MPTSIKRVDDPSIIINSSTGNCGETATKVYNKPPKTRAMKPLITVIVFVSIQFTCFGNEAIIKNNVKPIVNSPHINPIKKST
jgi:hypothetical protein